MTLLYCGGAVGYIIHNGEDSGLYSDIASGLILLAASVIGSYVFGAVWDDTRKIGNSSSERSE